MTPNALAVRSPRTQCLEFLRSGHQRRAHAFSAWFRPGGVHQDVPPKVTRRYRRLARHRMCRKLFEDAISLVADNRIFKQRNVDIATVTSTGRRCSLGLLRPDAARFSGIAWDLRKSQPYDVYDRMEFDVPVGTRGDCYDRFMVPRRGSPAKSIAHHETVHQRACPKVPIASHRPQGRAAQARRDETARWKR